MSATNSPPPTHDSPLWSRSAKIIVALIWLLLVALVARRFQALIAQIVVAAMIAYILNPAIGFLNRRFAVKRGTLILLVYLLLAVALVWALVSLGVAAFQQVNNLIDQVPDLISRSLKVFEEFTARTEPILIGSFALDPSDIPWDGITNQILGFAEPALGRGGQFVRQVATTTLRWAGNLLFIFVLSIYIANDIPKLGGYIADFAHHPGYRQDAEKLMQAFGRIWSSYLRGQVILGVVIGLVVWLSLSLMGVQNALALGLLSGLLEFIPILGPVIGAGVAMIVAFFQPSNFLAIPGWQFALWVLVVMFVIQQLENNILVPNIVGEALDMHPLLVMVSVFMGGSLAGILGAILAAPIAATIKLVGVYAWRKMFDLHPFPNQPDLPRSDSSRTFLNKWKRSMSDFLERRTKS